ATAQQATAQQATAQQATAQQATAQQATAQQATAQQATAQPVPTAAMAQPDAAPLPSLTTTPSPAVPPVAAAPTAPFTPMGTVVMDDASDIQAQARARQQQALSPSAQPTAPLPPTTTTAPVDPRAAGAPPAPQPVAAGPVPAAGPHAAGSHTAGSHAGGPSTAVERVPGMGDAPVPPAGTPALEVELDAHSASNFYKGLSGNDVIVHGGIFVQTYRRIPDVGAPVALKVLLPGDLQFDADAVVQWTRETRSGESDPGFGAKFTRISDVGRQLVYRYARNREPMFYDDL
ncbi:MAG: hypothetical protein AAGN82_04040, partial [Myxococcota bacterium]